MRSPINKLELESDLASRFGSVMGLQEKPRVDYLPTGITEIDTLTGGLPRGAITEIFGAASSGRTSLMVASLANATANEETCALVDLHDTFDVASAAHANLDFDRLLWIRCGGNLEHAFKATDMLLHAGGFGLVALDIADLAPAAARRIVTSWWFRFRHAVENTPTALVVVAPVSCTRSSATLALNMTKDCATWSTAAPSPALCLLPNSNSHSSLVIHQLSPASNSQSPTHTNLLRNTRLHIMQQKPILFGERVARIEIGVSC
jgi:hypothetical protein